MPSRRDLAPRDSSVAVGARNLDALQAGAKRLEARGVKVLAVPTDASSAKAVRAFIQKARSELGSIDVLLWNAAANLAGDLLSAPTDDLVAAFNTDVTGLVASIQEALPELKKVKNAAVLVTNGSFGLSVDAVDDAVVQYQAMGLAIANGAKHKAVHILSRRL